MEEEPEEEPDEEQIKKDQEIIRKLQEQKRKEQEKMFAKGGKDVTSKKKAQELFEKRLQKGTGEQSTEENVED